MLTNTTAVQPPSPPPPYMVCSPLASLHNYLSRCNLAWLSSQPILPADKTQQEADALHVSPPTLPPGLAVKWRPPLIHLSCVSLDIAPPPAHTSHSATHARPTTSWHALRVSAAFRLRLRLVKLGCISVDTGLLGNKALSVLKLLKPYKLKVMMQEGGGTLSLA
jgi:hypothetical protein